MKDSDLFLPNRQEREVREPICDSYDLVRLRLTLELFS